MNRLVPPGRAVFPVRDRAARARPASSSGLAGRRVPVEQATAGRTPLLLLAGQLLEPFTACDQGQNWT